MAATQPPDAPVPPAVPPIYAGPLAGPPRRTVWPTVIGIIAIVWASVGLLGGACGLLMPSAVGQIAASSGDKAMLDLQKQGPWMTVSSLASVGLAGLLLAAGIGVVSRRPWARKSFLVWAVIDIIWVGAGSLFTYKAMQTQFATMVQDPNVPASVAAMGKGFAGVGAGLGACVGLLLPIFALIWFSRAVVKAEIAQWV
jgi:hypothetical protein